MCARGFVSAVELLVHRSSITAAYIMDLLRKIAECYERFDCRLTISAMIEVFYDHLNNYFTRLHHYIGTDVELPPHVSTVTPELQMALDNMAEVARQPVARHIMPDSGRGLTVSRYTVELVQDLRGKHASIDKAMGEQSDRGIDEKSSSDEDEPQRRKRQRK